MSRRLAIIEGQRAALIYAAPDPEQARRIRALEAENDILRRQLMDVRPSTPEPLSKLNARRHADSERLHTTIARIAGERVEQHEKASAKAIVEALTKEGFKPLPAERTVRLHLAEIRANGSTL